MKTSYFSKAIDDALAQAMTEDQRIVLFGEDVPLLRRNLLVRFGPARVRGAPISESAFLGAGVAAAMISNTADIEQSMFLRYYAVELMNEVFSNTSVIGFVGITENGRTIRSLPVKRPEIRPAAMKIIEIAAGQL